MNQLFLLAQQSDNSTGFFDVLQKLDGFSLMVVSIVAVCALAGVIKYGLHQWRSYQAHQLDTSLKQDLLDRGMSVEEVERMVKLRSEDAPPPGD